MNLSLPIMIVNQKLKVKLDIYGRPRMSIEKGDGGRKRGRRDRKRGRSEKGDGGINS